MNQAPKKLKAVSLFTGAGGMDVGFERAGFSVVWANEIMPHAARTYELNHPSSNMHCGDLADFKDKLPSPSDGIDCVFGGPPCQGFSVAGKMDPNDPRSKLVFDFLDVVARVRPRFFVMENVRALAELEKFSSVRERLKNQATALGYSSEFIVLNAKDFGVPQSRVRMFFIGFRINGEIQIDLEPYKKEAPSLRKLFQSIGPAGTEKNPLTCKARITLAKYPILRKSPYAGMLFNGLGRPLNLEGVSCTLPASMGGNKTPFIDTRSLEQGRPAWVEEYHAKLWETAKDATPKGPEELVEAPDFLRRLTVKEAQLIQTFPSDYEFAGPMSSQYTQIGNAVPCDLAYAVARATVDFYQKLPTDCFGIGVTQLELF
jgi:DNA (cytosine-5)-methyltransferase 1